MYRTWFSKQSRRTRSISSGTGNFGRDHGIIVSSRSLDTDYLVDGTEFDWTTREQGRSLWSIFLRRREGHVRNVGYLCVVRAGEMDDPETFL